MPGLPKGWESDYDGKRWFYTYKATGQVQYHFPSDGDEFPDYVDAASPAPVLAPEERLASQQQVKRHGSTYTGRTTAVANAADERILPWQGTPNNGQIVNQDWSGNMSATARPVSFVWEGEDADSMGQREEDAVFRPESFMFLGPGTYNDVSPLAEDDDEAAKRIIAGAERSKGISPDVSTENTPQVEKCELKSLPNSTSTEDLRTIAMLEREESIPDPPSAVDEEPVVHMIDGREIPMELAGSEPWQDPVGRVAEMPTGDTPVARIETHPEPVEIGEGRELISIEASASAGAAELPLVDGNLTAVVGDKEVSAPNPSDVAIRPKEEILVEPNASDSMEDPAKQDRITNVIAKNETTEAAAAAVVHKYQPYNPGQIQPDFQPRRSDEINTYQSSLQRERSLMMGPSSSGETTSQSSSPTSAQNAPVPGHHLTSIEEHDEATSNYDASGAKAASSKTPSSSRASSTISSYALPARSSRTSSKPASASSYTASTTSRRAALYSGQEFVTTARSSLDCTNCDKRDG
ncbi:hypothetical protein NLU13_9537 [Sarocladium strictum]|uniref:WW domain-containing protein n=1 Tax=Sarocladium strictum TaxID=5046 RepID=A0AA39L3Y4_SARSR|nr:hypothetical protein NLU13_9537 [Sarocladium strictum]